MLPGSTVWMPRSGACSFYGVVTDQQACHRMFGQVGVGLHPAVRLPALEREAAQPLGLLLQQG